MSLLSDIDKQLEDQSILIQDWIKENYTLKGELKIHDNIVDVIGDIYVLTDIKQLTNDDFKFGKIIGDFNCGWCKALTSLEGAPEYVSGDFECSGCSKLITLEGAPKKVGGSFYCSECNRLISLKGCPKEVGGSFDCKRCENLKSIEDAPPRETVNGFIRMFGMYDNINFNYEFIK